MGVGVGQKKKKKLPEKLADCVASVTNAAEPRIAANLFLSGFLFRLFLFLHDVFPDLRRSLKKRWEFQEARRTAPLNHLFVIA